MSFPAPSFSGKPRTADGAVVDWVGLHLAPPDPAAPFVPPAWPRPSEGAPRASYLPACRDEPTSLLTAEELDAYDREGFILRAGGGIPVLSAAEVAEQSALWEEIFRHSCEGDPQGVNGFFKRYGGAYDLVSHPAVVQLAREILGPRLACWGAHWMCKPAGDTAATPLGMLSDGVTPAPHQDALGWPFRPARTATVWVALDDVAEDNGPMCAWPGSHLHGEVPCGDMEEVAALDAHFGPARPLFPIRAGHASLHCDMVVHSSPPSQPNAGRRLAVGIEFVGMDHGVTDRGSGWGVRCPRPLLPSARSFRHPIVVARQAACFVVGGSVTPAEAAAGFGHLPRPEVYGPPGLRPIRDAAAL